MSELISGKDALKHVAECTVQYQHPDEPKGVWTTITNHFWDQYSLGIFLNEDTKFKFRLKPRTIKINGIDIDKPSEKISCINGDTICIKYSDSEKLRRAYDVLVEIFNDH